MFVGCSRWQIADRAKDHRGLSIPRNINEDLVYSLFRNDGKLPDDVSIGNRKLNECAFTISSRSGGKGKGFCRTSPYI